MKIVGFELVSQETLRSCIVLSPTKQNIVGDGCYAGFFARNFLDFYFLLNNL